MPYCQECGAKLPDEEKARFCPNCGAPMQPPSRIIKPVEVSRAAEREKSRRLESVIAATLICFIITFFGTVLPIDSAEAQAVFQEFSEFEKTFEKVNPFFTIALFYGNNFMHSLAMFTPFVGPFYGFYVLFSTGRVIAAMAQVQRSNPLTLLIFTFVSPHSWIEYVSYGLALSESFWLALMILRHRFREELVNVFKAISACALLLLSAAFIETYLISSLTQEMELSDFFVENLFKGLFSYA